MPCLHATGICRGLASNGTFLVGIVVDDLAAAIEFFGDLGLVRQGDGSAEGGWVDGIVGVEGVQADLAMMQTSDGNGPLELVRIG